MEPLSLSVKLESNHSYYAENDISVYLKQTFRLTDSIYRSLYTSEKKYLDTAFYLNGLKNVTLDFCGKTLLLHDETIQPFVLHNCENITVKNLTILYERSFMNEIDVVDADSERIVLKQTERQKKFFPIKVEDGLIIPVSGEKEYRDGLAYPHFFNLYSKETGEVEAMCLIRVGKDLPEISKEEFPWHYYVLCAEQKGDCIELRGEIPQGIRPGTVSVQSHSRRDVSALFLISSQGILLENVRVMNGSGMGILGMYTKDITLNGVKFLKDEQSQGMSTNAADAVHLVSCSGKIEMTDSIFEGMKDDAVNIHCNYYTVTSVKDGLVFAKIKTDIQREPVVNAHYKMFDQGDCLQLFSGCSMVEKGRYTVKNVEVTDEFEVALHLDGDLEGIEAGDTLENFSTQPECHIQRCRFGKAKTHLRLQSRGKIVMEDCECSLVVLLPGDKNYWYEGSPVRDLTIQNCTFTGAGGRIVSRPDYFEVRPEESYYHKGIKILSNRFEAENALTLSSCEGVTFLGNTNTRGVPFQNQFTDCDKIETDA